MKKLPYLLPLACVAITSTSFGANVPATAVGVYDESAVSSNSVDFEAAGNSQTLPAFSSAIVSAYANDLGGVIDFNGTGTLAVGDTLTSTFGVNNTQSLVLTNTHTPGASYQWGSTSTSRTAISGAAGEFLGLTGGFGTWNNFAFALSGQQVNSLGLTMLSRSGNATTSASLTVTFDDASTAVRSPVTIANSNAGGDTFFQVDAASGRYITSFKLTLATNDPGYFSSIDDIGFTVVPEPSTYALLAGLLGLAAVVMRRRR